MRFVAVDVETANQYLDSICQIGVVTFDEFGNTKTWHSLINPKEEFAWRNVEIHGITLDKVQGKPTFTEVYPKLCELLTGQIVVHHTHFDRTALGRAFDRYRLARIQCTWLDTARVVRRAYPHLAKRGYNLWNVARMLKIKFRHHAAKEDAKTTGKILIAAMRKWKMTIPEWLVRVEKPLKWESSSLVKKAITHSAINDEQYRRIQAALTAREKAKVI